MQLKRIWVLTTLLLTVLVCNAQLQVGKKNIEKLCGCFDVEFKYAETFSPDNTYKFHERENLHGTELVLPIETSDKKLSCNTCSSSTTQLSSSTGAKIGFLNSLRFYNMKAINNGQRLR